MHIYESPFPPVHIPTDLSLPQFLLEYNPDNTPSHKVVLEDFDSPGKTVTYGGCRTAAAQGGAGLRDMLGLKEGDVVAILGRNSVDWAILAFSVMWAGGTTCAVNPAATANELVHYLEIADAKYIFMEEDLIPKVQEALRLSEGMKTQPMLAILGDCIGDTPFTTFPQDIIDEKGAPLTPYNLPEADNRKHTAMILFSSGTTRKPKGVLLSHHNLIAYQLVLRGVSPFMNKGFQREVVYAPFSHIFGFFIALSSICIGQYTVAMREYQFHDYLSRCAKIRATILRIIPTTAVSMIRDRFARSLDLRSVRTVMCAAAALREETAQQLQVLLGGVDIVQAYGLSESFVSILSGGGFVVKAGSVGQIIPGGCESQVRIVDDDHNDVAPEQSGELLIKSPTLFMGYKCNQEATHASIRDGWFNTGDIVRVDSRGYLWLTGRKEDMIKYKGNQVSPAELEDVLLSHPDVTEAAVCGIWDEPNQTEIPVGYVNLLGAQSSLAEQLSARLQEVRDFVDARVDEHKKLRGGVHFQEEFPKSPTGKLMRRLLPPTSRLWNYSRSPDTPSSRQKGRKVLHEDWLT